MAKRILLSDAEVTALHLIEDRLPMLADQMTIDSLDQRGLIRLRDGEWTLTPWGEEVLGSIAEPEVGYGTAPW